MNGNQRPTGGLEENVRRLFERLERGGAMAETTRDRILHRLLREATPPRSTRAVRRWVRWVGLAAALLVASGIILTGALDNVGEPRGPETAEKRAGTVTAESPAGPTLVGFAIHLLASGPGRGVVEASSAESGGAVYIQSERYVSNADVESARVERVPSGCQVEIRLTREGTDKLARLTRGHIGDRLAMVIGGEVVMSPTIRSEITQGLVLLTGKFSDSRCEEIARGLSAPG